jgi:hypothetical protein
MMPPHPSVSPLDSPHTTAANDRPEYRSLSEIARRLPPNRGAKPVHAATLSRWITKGVWTKTGQLIKLQARRFPAGWRTTDQWVEEFLEAYTAAELGNQPPAGEPSTPMLRTVLERRRAHQRAKAELKAAGF